MERSNMHSSDGAGCYPGSGRAELDSTEGPHTAMQVVSGIGDPSKMPISETMPS